ncbi:MAG: hypothetical protein K8R90_10135 [Candidatus Cloacimonetes bacterium]|nr:hypothetical protein [Candidatus Cloacimonadota bacterium]
MKLKLVVSILFFLQLAGICYSQEPELPWYKRHSERVFARYSHEFDTFDRYSFGFGVNLFAHVYTEFDFLGMVATSEDPYSIGQGNYSVAPLVFSAFCLLTGGFRKSPVYWGPDINLISALPMLLTNTRYIFPLFKGAYKYDHSVKYTYFPRFSLFVENSTDYFYNRNHKWAQIAPGAGLRVYFGHPYIEWGLSVGYKRAFQTDFSGRTHSKNIYFVGWGGDFLLCPV